MKSLARGAQRGQYERDAACSRGKSSMRRAIIALAAVLLTVSGIVLARAMWSDDRTSVAHPPRSEWKGWHRRPLTSQSRSQWGSSRTSGPGARRVGNAVPGRLLQGRRVGSVDGHAVQAETARIVTLGRSGYNGDTGYEWRCDASHQSCPA